MGLSAIARVLLERGYRISGSDRAPGAYAEALARDGALIFSGHDAANVAGADAVIISSAVHDNPEIAAARAAGIPVYKRSDMIAGLMGGQMVIAVAGSHGKTTTTAMIAHILSAAGLQPGYIIGGTLKSAGVNAAAGAGRVFVIEADEYDHMFLGLRPNVAVITNVEWDHPDFFPTADVFYGAFAQFAALLPPGGVLIACADDMGANRLAEEHAGRVNVQTYGANESPGWALRGIQAVDGCYRADLMSAASEAARLELAVPGRVNLLNAAAAVIAASTVGVPPAEAAAALSTFTGVGRRFDLIGEVAGVAVIDDYGHNPAKIRATLAAARARYPERDIWAVWQPHTFSRTQTFLAQYAEAFEDADHVLVAEIYAAREAPVPAVTGAAVAAALHHPDARFTPSFAAAVDSLANEAQPPAAVVLLSAGDANRIGPALLQRLSEEP
ncbi:MAG: UDP-N-acetylmuramate--L-alanine ligase [Anaerolineae bacterium]|nr:UDP-N-acetylmuramate--L-alanine ligase [Anaerolineae bacterium]